MKVHPSQLDERARGGRRGARGEVRAERRQRDAEAAEYLGEIVCGEECDGEGGVRDD
ncbi:hypothetical protein SCWH03_34920 [Streptomyces pacificus]|uniref:Uncharacterized protein n=1 Tax=Streptomyces pacificus TaxID=2705029 RepID=A0A6A0AWI3_9ACTN|nr:hypothetical protein SCWH03_34920 [Streptomyces pacificus]